MTDRSADAMIVAIDGPAGAGKSSVSREVARRLDFGYLDTGAVYRALGWFVVQRGVDTVDTTAVAGALATFSPRVSLDPDDRSLLVDGDDVSARIRTAEAAAGASAIAKLPPYECT